MPAITDPNEPYFKDGIWGWDGAVWRRLPILWGYSNTWFELHFNVGCALGTNILTFANPPAGEIWTVNSVCWANTKTACTSIACQVDSAGGPYAVELENTPVMGDFYTIYPKLVLGHDDPLRVAFYDCAVNDHIFAYVTGYKMNIAE